MKKLKIEYTQYKFLSLYFTRFDKTNFKGIRVNNENRWEKKLRRICCMGELYREIAQRFWEVNIDIDKEIPLKPDKILALCVVKNDLIKIKNFLQHHRKLGIEQFVILDNDSDKYVNDWLKEQEDVYLLTSKDTYSTVTREAWINRMFAFFGENRWYYVADSDELLVYNDCENRPIGDVIEYCVNNNLSRLRGCMIDMYAKDSLYKNDEEDKNYLEKYIYFDADGYEECENNVYDGIYGGVRKRIFGVRPLLTKYPVFYLGKRGVEIKSHCLYPLKDNFNKDCSLILMHYKFLPGEITKYKDIAKRGNYYNGSEEYKRYASLLDQDSTLDFFVESSKVYNDSSSFNCLGFYKKIEFENSIE